MAFWSSKGDHEPPSYFMRARNSGGTDYYKEDANQRTQSLHDDVGLFVMSYEMDLLLIRLMVL